MKDLDFDELDRAVNSLMTNVPKTPESKKEEQTLTITPTLKDGTPPPLDTLDKTKTDSPGSMPVPSSPPPADDSRGSSRSPLASRRGRFMDVVRPGATKPAETARPSRQGMTVTPSGPLMADVVSSSDAPKKMAAPVVEQPEPKSDWPDPLDVTQPGDGAGQKPLKDISHEELLMASNMTPSDTHDEYAPLASPFLAGTKVEKRPLGGSQVLPDGSGERSATDAKDADASAQLPADPAKITHDELPEELSSDLMAIESGANTTKPVPETTPDEPAVPIEPVKPAAIPDVTPQTATTPPPEEKLLPAGPISIPQQYREEPSTGDKESGSIYDTDTYHQPLSHPAKKKSGWMWVVWIVVILLVGAAGGAALYFAGIF